MNEDKNKINPNDFISIRPTVYKDYLTVLC